MGDPFFLLTWESRKNIPNQYVMVMGRVGEALRYYNYARSPEKTYCQWIVRFICFYEKKQHPKDMGLSVVDTTLERWSSQMISNDVI